MRDEDVVYVPAIKKRVREEECKPCTWCRRYLSSKFTFLSHFLYTALFNI